MNRSGLVESASGLRGFRLLRLGGSAFQGFVRDEYTTLPDIENRPLHMWLDLEWRYIDPEAAFSGRRAIVTARVRRIVLDIFEQFESGSIQQVIYRWARGCSRRSRDRRGAPRGEQPHVGYDCRARRRRSASTPMRGRRTAAWG